MNGIFGSKDEKIKLLNSKGSIKRQGVCNKNSSVAIKVQKYRTVMCGYVYKRNFVGRNAKKEHVEWIGLKNTADTIDKDRSNSIFLVI